MGGSDVGSRVSAGNVGKDDPGDGGKYCGNIGEDVPTSNDGGVMGVSDVGSGVVAGNV